MEKITILLQLLFLPSLVLANPVHLSFNHFVLSNESIPNEQKFLYLDQGNPNIEFNQSPPEKWTIYYFDSKKNIPLNKVLEILRVIDEWSDIYQTSHLIDSILEKLHLELNRLPGNILSSEFKISLVSSMIKNLGSDEFKERLEKSPLRFIRGSFSLNFTNKVIVNILSMRF